MFFLSSEVEGPVAEVDLNLFEFEIVSTAEDVLNATEEYCGLSTLDPVLQNDSFFHLKLGFSFNN